MLIKICGATSTSELHSLRTAGIDLVGLWYELAGGRAELDLVKLTDLAAACRVDPAMPEPVLVTFLKDAKVLCEAVDRSGVQWVQLHGFQPPGVISALKQSSPNLTVIKVVHVDGNTCPEKRLFAAYARAGTDIFLLDAMSGSGAVGSTGRALDETAVLELVQGISLPFMLAGGLTAGSRDVYDAVVSHPQFLGIDVDTGARDSLDRICADRATDIHDRWATRNAPEKLSCPI